MFKKIVFGLLTCLLALTLVGCGAKKDEAKPAADAKPEAKQETKAEVAKPEAPADKAVLAYAQLYAYGVVEDENEKAAGMTEKDTKPVEEKVIGDLLKAFSQFPLSDENVQNATSNYIQKLHNGMEITATLKKDDPEHPVVELSAETLDVAGAMKVSQTSEDIQALAAALQELHAQGITDEQLKENPEFQNAVLEVIDNFTNEYPLNPRASIDVTCEVNQGSDGKFYWAPQDPTAVAKFVTGQK